jgi:hypothetical protein
LNDRVIPLLRGASIVDAADDTITCVYTGPGGRLSAIKYPSADTTGVEKDSTTLTYDGL